MISRYLTKKHDACDGLGCEECDYDGDVVDRFRTDTEMIRGYVQQAEVCYHSAESSEKSAYWLGKGDQAMQLATQYAAIAQTDALQRIAECLETWVEMQTVGPAETPASRRGMREAENQWTYP